VRPIGTIETGIVWDQRAVMDGLYLATLFRARITHLGDTRLTRVR
jgi:hypothetical protein